MISKEKDAGSPRFLLFKLIKIELGCLQTYRKNLHFRSFIEKEIPAD